MSAQIETSDSERSRAEGAADALAGKNPRREAAKSEGAGAEKRAVLSLFRIRILASLVS